MTDDAKMVFGDLYQGCSEREFLDVFGQPPRSTPIVPPDTEAIEWARELDRAARRHDDARTPPERFAAFKAVYNLCVHDERMVQIARALLAREGVLKTCLCVLVAARDGQSWSSNMIKDFNCAIDGIRALSSSSGE